MIGLPLRVRDIAAMFAAYEWRDLLWSLGVLASAWICGRIASAVVTRALERWARAKKASLADVIAVRIHGPVRWLGPLLAIDLAVPLLTLPAELLDGVRESVLVGVIGGLGWLAVRVVGVAETVVVRRVNVSLADNLHARAVYTQMRGMRNVASFIVVVITVAFALMSFERVRHLGTGLLASAGLAGLALGFAAQKSLAAVLAGIQIAVTQPIRVDDVVIVEGEWGKIEEITLTYVVVKVWDLRRLIVPVEYFIDKPFQNWTRTQANLLGTVELHLDYSGSVEVVRREFKRILDQSELWDRHTSGVQVTDATERTMLVRLLMSANNAGTAFDLRCDVREKIIDFLQRDHPDWLPRLRGEVTTQSSPLVGKGPDPC